MVGDEGHKEKKEKKVKKERKRRDKKEDKKAYSVEDKKEEKKKVEDKKEEKKKVSPAKVARKRFKDVEKKEPRRAKKIKERISGEIYGLYPTSSGYASDIVVDVVFKEGIYQYGLD
jgi:hypothetical protein